MAGQQGKPADAAKPQEGVPADLLKKATAAPTGKKLETWNPMENIPTLAVGDDFKQGMTISGWFEETQLIASPKFTHSQEKNEAGVPVQRRHVLRIGSPTGDRLGIWNCGELRVGFEKLTPGTFVAITYKGKGKNAKGQDQHFFEFQREPVVQ